MKNVNETHFVININNGHTLGFKQDTIVKYAKAISNEDSITMVIRIFQGQRSIIKTPMMIFTNTNSTYLIHGLEDNIHGVCYRIEPKGWMDYALFSKFFTNSRSFQANVYGCTKVSSVDNCIGHSIFPTLRNVLVAK